MKDLNFFAVIPAPVLNDGDLLPGAKLLFGIVSQLLNEKGYCYATNNLFAERLHISERTVRAWLSDLQRMGHIDIEIDRDRATIQEPQPRIYSRYRGGSTLPAGGGSTLPAYNKERYKKKEYYAIGLR